MSEQDEAGPAGRLGPFLKSCYLVLPALLLLLGARAWQAGEARAASEAGSTAQSVAAHFADGHTHGVSVEHLGLSGTEREVTGSVTVVWGDTQDGAGTEPLFFIRLDDGTQIPALASSGPLAMALAKTPAGNLVLRVADLPAGSAAPGSGLPEPELTILSAEPPAGSPAPGPTPVTGSHPWVTVMCKFADYPAEPWTPASVNALMTNSASAPGLDYYWRQVSYDTFNIAGSVLAGGGWYTLPSPRSAYASGGVLDFQKLVNDCTSLADASVNFASFSGVNMMFNATLDINGAGNMAWGGSAFVSADSAGVKRMTWMPSWANQAVLGHETGHGFGLPHSWSGYGISYGSLWDVMSSYGTCIYYDVTWGCFPVHTIAEYKDTLGVLPPASKFTPALNSKQVVELAQLDNFDGDPGTYMMIRVPSLGGAGGSGFDYYTMELRRQNGAYDRNTPAGPTGAVVIHEVLSTRTSQYGSHPAKVVDLENDGDAADCNSISFCSDVANDARWVEGEVFWDQANQIMFKVIDLGANGLPATVAIRYGNPALQSLDTGFDQEPPARVASGQVFSRQPIVSVRDSDTLPNTNDNASVVTLAVVPPGPTLSCTGGNSLVVDGGIAAFSGCSLTGSPGSYQLEATSPGLSTSYSFQGEIEEQLDCTTGTCVFDFNTDNEGFVSSGLWHRETLAVPAGMSGPNMAFNQGCTGPGLTGCNYDAGAVGGVAASPLLNLGDARLLTFKSVRVTGDTLCTPSLDYTHLSYTLDGSTFSPLELGQRAAVSAGGQFAPWNANGQLCGNSTSSQTISVLLPAGTVGISFAFSPNGAFNNSEAGWFIDDIQFTVPSAPVSLAVYWSYFDRWFEDTPFPSQPVFSVRDSSGAELWDDNTTQITIGLLQNGAAQSPAEPLPNSLPEVEALSSPDLPAPTVLSSASADPAPPPGTLTCATPLTLTVSAGRAQFLGCQINELGLGYNLSFSTTFISGYLVAPINIVVPWNCDAGDCDDSFDSPPAYDTANLGHWETNAQVTGMTSPMLAINFGCTGPGTTGCSYDTGNTNGSGFRMPLLVLSNANRLEFSISKDTSPGVTCGTTDNFYVYTTTNRISWQALNLYQDATITPGPLHFEAGFPWGVCGEGAGTQQISVKLPPGTLGVYFWFAPIDTIDNDHPGIFIDDVDFTSAPTSLAFVQQPPGNVSPGFLFDVAVAVLDGNGQITTSNDSTEVTIGTLFAGTLMCADGVVQAAVAGIATFEDCSIESSSTELTGLGASAQGVPNAFSSSVIFSDAPGTHWYFAEGFTGLGWVTTLHLLNTSGSTATAQVSYLLDGGTPVNKTFQIPSQQVLVVLANDPDSGPGPDYAFGVRVIADRAMVVEEQMYAGASGDFAHGTQGATSLSTSWYFAEGFTEFGWQTFVLLANPGQTDASVDVTYQVQGGAAVVKQVLVPAGTRATLLGHVDVPDSAFSVSVSSSAAVVAEMAMYDPGRSVAHRAIGVTATSTEWYLGEGFTGFGWETFISVGNPTANAATVTAIFNIDGGAPVVRQIVVPANSRGTFIARDLASGPGIDVAFGAKITSTQPIVVQEVLIDPNPAGSRANSTMAAPALGSSWSFSGASSLTGAVSFFTVANPSPSSVNVTATYYFDDGTAPVVQQQSIPASSRRTFATNGGSPSVPSGHRVGVVISATGGLIVAQEAVYDESSIRAFSAAGLRTP